MRGGLAAIHTAPVTTPRVSADLRCSVPPISGPVTYDLSMDTLSIIRLCLIGFAVVGIGYSCIGTGFLKNEETGWWDTLPREKRVVFVAAIFASALQTFL